MTPEQRPKTSEIPTQPGVYRFRNQRNQVIYVGKAKNLRNRLSSYFVDSSRLHPRTARMVAAATGVSWVVVGSEVEALTLEYTWIKEFNPQFNVMFKDDKSYPYFALTLNQEYPRMGVWRGAHQRGVRYFGPYTAVWAIRQTQELLETVFPLRTCSDGVFAQAQSAKRACLKGHIGRCAAPCVNRISVQDYRELVNSVCDFMAGKEAGVLKQLESEMWQCADAHNYEAAAKKRDQLQALQKVLEKNAVILDDDVDADLFALAADELQVSIQVFYVRAGRIRGQRGWVSNREEEAETEDLMSLALEQIYAQRAADLAEHGPQRVGPNSPSDSTHFTTTVVPKEVLVSIVPSGKETLQKWLSTLRGSAVSLRCPQRGVKKAALQRVELNAIEALKLYKTRRASDLTQRNLALNELGHMLGIDPPLRIECFDISHTQGTHQMASMVVFEDGAPRKNAYRKFSLKGSLTNPHPDDTAAMNEVLTRRFERLIAEENSQAQSQTDSAPKYSENLDTSETKPEGESSELRRFSYRPDLVVVDGGLPQVHAARAAMDAVGVWDIPVVGLAKRLEEVWRSDDDFPVIFPRSSIALYLLQYLRDESHRFAISAHRHRRSKAMTRSALDQIPGVGLAKQKALLKHFGSVKRIRAASVDQLQEVPGIGSKLAQIISAYLSEIRPD